MSDGYDSSCPRCQAILTAGGCLSCGYPANRPDSKAVADTREFGMARTDCTSILVALEHNAMEWLNLNTALARKIEELNTTYESSHESRMHAEAVVRRLESELAEAEELILYMLQPDLEKWVTTERVMGVQRTEVERIVAYVDAHPAARRVRAKAEAAP